MRWKVRPHGETRRLKRFALFPVLIGDEWIWLEFYTKIMTWIDGTKSIYDQAEWRTRLERGWQPAEVTVEVPNG